jgi:hypothetical protein
MIDILKKLMKSKTIIVNSLLVATGTIGYLAGHEVIAANPAWAAALVGAAGVLNVALRVVTTIPVWEK